MIPKIITEEKIQEFKMYLYEEERSENTIKKYKRDIYIFKDHADGADLKKADILCYKEELCSKYAPSSVNSILSSLNAFFIFLNWHDLKVKTLKIQRKIFCDKKKELSKKEYERLLTASIESKNYRLYYLLQTMASTGVRVSEIKYITCEAVMNGCALINCKGKIRQILLPQILCDMLKSIIKTQNIKSGAVFISKHGNPIDRSNIWKMLKAVCKRAHVSEEKVYPHSFRHLFARTFYSARKDIVHLADILGHSSINTTRIYTTESSESHMKQLQNLGLLRQ